MIQSETRPGRAGQLRHRYDAADLSVLTRDEASRFISDGHGDPRTDAALAWQLLYRLEPELYDRLASAEHLHPGVVGWLPRSAARIVEVGAGTGRLTMELIDRSQLVIAVEPAKPLRRILTGKLAAADNGGRVRVVHGFFDDLPIADDFADLVVACSAFTPAPGHGGEAGLAEMERVCRPGGQVIIIWPSNTDWLTDRGYQYVSFGGPMEIEFASVTEAVDLAEIFYPDVAGEVRRRGQPQVPFELLGVNPPRDLAVKTLAQ